MKIKDNRGPLDMLSAEDVALRLGLGRSRVYKLIADGAIPFVRIGRRIRIPSSAWQIWLAHQDSLALASLQDESGAKGGDNFGDE